MWNDTRIEIAAGTAALPLAAYVFARDHRNSIYDDAFNYLRYVRNRNDGCGLRFNCAGEPVEGAISPLFLALLWLGSSVTKRLIDLCQIVNTIALIGAGELAIATAAGLAKLWTDDTLSRWMPSVLAMSTAIVLSLDDFVLLNTNIGFETSLAAFTCTLLVFSVIAKQLRVTAAGPVQATFAWPEVILCKDYPRGALVATVPLGAVGYYSSLPILDLVGLTDATVVRAGRSVPSELLTKRWIGYERHHAEYVLERAPSVIVTTMVRDRPWRALGEARAGFWAHWLLLQQIKRGEAHYVVRDAELPSRHVLMFERTP